MSDTVIEQPHKSRRYNPAEIEPKWQRAWEANRAYEADLNDEARHKYYFLTMYPYPSGDLHIGHWYAFAPADAAARYRKMQGHNVFFPIGFDAFGLPAENAAVRAARQGEDVHPATLTYQQIARMIDQFKTMGTMFDWSKQISTCDPAYYRWNQWLFLKFYERGLAYKKESPVDWCPNCNTTLAREQVIEKHAERVCERCETPVTKKTLSQWYFRITDYADELLDFSGLDWPEKVRVMQTNWIGRSEGAEVAFKSEQGDDITVFTTRPDTLWGATFMVLAPEHPLTLKLTTDDRRAAVEAYVEQAASKTEIDRQAEGRDKTGEFTGAYAINPVNGARIPIWTADYVVMAYGSGAIMAVPGHDDRDFEFAFKHGIPVIPVISRPAGQAKSLLVQGTYHDGLAAALEEAGFEAAEGDGSLQVVLHESDRQRYAGVVQNYLKEGCFTAIVGGSWEIVFPDEIAAVDSLESEARILRRCRELQPEARPSRTVAEMLFDVPFYGDAVIHTAYGTMINSGELSGTPGKAAVSDTIHWLEARGYGKGTVSYRLRDWLISRQRYWGTPIPINYCDECGIVPVPESELPVELPSDVAFMPTGESPLKSHQAFYSTTCPSCGGGAIRETDTMDTFVDSAWYWFRYLSPDKEDAPFDRVLADRWMPVEQYTGGVEHAILHLLYARFFTKVMRDMGLTKVGEPFVRLRNQGMILGEDNEKMSKSRGNVVNPDSLVKEYGADTVRAYLMFIGPWEAGGPWSYQGIEGVARFMNRVWSIVTEPAEADGPADENTLRELRRAVHTAIKEVTEDFEEFRFNTAVAELMTLSNAMGKAKSKQVVESSAWSEAVDTLAKLLAPIATHLAEELWHQLGKPGSIHEQRWPRHDPAAIASDTVTLAVQVNGKRRAEITVPKDADKAAIIQAAKSERNVARHLEGVEIVREIVVPERLVNLVVKG